MRFIIPLALCAAGCTNAFAQNPMRPEFDISKVVEMARSYCAKTGLGDQSSYITSVSYKSRGDYWLVIYSSDSLNIGSSGFGLEIDDSETGSIALQKGL